MKAKLKQQKDYSYYVEKREKIEANKKREEFKRQISDIKNSVNFYKIMDELYPEKTDEELIQEFKENHPDLELEENQEIAINNLYGTRIAQVCIVHNDGSRTFLASFDDEYFENIQKYIKANMMFDGLFYGANFEEVKESSGLSYSEIEEFNREFLSKADNVVFYLKEKLNTILEKENKRYFFVIDKIKKLFSLNQNDRSEEIKKIEDMLEKFKKGEISGTLPQKSDILHEAHNLAGLEFDENLYRDIELLFNFFETRDKVSSIKEDGTFGKTPEIADGAAGIMYKVFYDKYLK